MIVGCWFGRDTRRRSGRSIGLFGGACRGRLYIVREKVSMIVRELFFFFFFFFFVLSFALSLMLAGNGHSGDVQMRSGDAYPSSQST